MIHVAKIIGTGSATTCLMGVGMSILLTLAYYQYIGFPVMELASDISPTSVQGLRISVAILQARKASLEVAAHAEGARLRALIASGNEGRPLNLTSLANIAREEESVMAEISRLTTLLNNATSSLPE
uniref:Uncharacterized protein n=1 Tax=Zymoseptoria tritici (strain CBS 115943 / IPO323) TaxID=336722 RepID=A9Y5I2_ZYMTI|nr:hypothetical protein [Zymoseptoria tritici]ABU40269.1 unknown [Zymoseptoria tritici]